MSPTELFVLVAGAALVVWINWYFFVAGHAARQARGRGVKRP